MAPHAADRLTHRCATPLCRKASRHDRLFSESQRREVPASRSRGLRRRVPAPRAARLGSTRGRQGGRGRHGAGVRGRRDGRHRRRLGRRGRAADQVRDRLPAPQHAQLLEDRAPQPRRLPDQGGGPRGRRDHRPLRAREEDAHGDLRQRLPQARRLRGRGRPVRLRQAGAREHAQRPDRHGRAGGDPQDDRRQDPGALPGADRDDGGARNDRVRRLADPEEGVRRPRPARRRPCSATATNA